MKVDSTPNAAAELENAMEVISRHYHLMRQELDCGDHSPRASENLATKSLVDP